MIGNLHLVHNVLYCISRTATPGGQEAPSYNNLITLRSAKIRCRTIPLEEGALTKGKVAVNIDDAEYISVEKFNFIDVPDVQKVFPMDSVRE